MRPFSWLLQLSGIFSTSNNAKRAAAHSISVIATVQSLLPTLIIFLITSAISVLMVEIVIFAATSVSYSLTVAKTVEANLFALHKQLATLILIHSCYTAVAEAASFLCSSYSHLQVQTVPSSSRDAPCPVVTPSRRNGLGSALSALKTHYAELYYLTYQPNSASSFSSRASSLSISARRVGI